jgi:hypothetical protein
MITIGLEEARIILLIILIICSLAIFGRPKDWSFRSKRGVKLNVEHNIDGSYRIKTDLKDPETQRIMAEESKRLNDWWESSKNCKHK